MNTDRSCLFDGFPFFAHFSAGEREALLSVSKEISYPAGAAVDLRSARSLCLIISGYFRSESPLHRDESVLFGPGSILGALPFSSQQPRGIAKALVPSSAVVIELEELYRVLISSYRSARGFIRLLNKSSLELTAHASEISNCRSRVVSVIGSRGAGKTLSSILLAAALSKKGRTILLDASSSGRSLFDYFQVKILPPLSQKKAGSLSDPFLSEHISKVSDNLDIMNIASGSKVSVDPGIISPVLFFLSRIYSYIVIDCGSDNTVSEGMLAGSDFVCAVARKKRDYIKIRSFCDSAMTDGQELFFCHNGFFRDRPLSAPLMLLDRVSLDGEYSVLPEVAQILGGAEAAAERISGRRELFLLQGAGAASAHYSPLLDLLAQSRGVTVAAESFSFACLALHSAAGGDLNGCREVASFFRDEQLRKMIAPVFPDKWLFDSSRVVKSFGSLGHALRLESLPVPVLASLGTEKGEDRLFSSGKVRELAAASLCEPLLFKPVKSGSLSLCSPSGAMPRSVTLSFDQISACYVRSGGASFRKGLFPLYCETVSRKDLERYNSRQKWIPDRNIVIDADAGNLSNTKALTLSREKWEKALSPAVKE